MKQPGHYFKKARDFQQNDKEIARQSKTTNRNVGLVHPNNVEDTNLAQLTTMNVLIATRKDTFVEQLFVHILKRKIQPAV